MRYFRDDAGRLMRGRCYGGINGMWTVIFGPGPRDHTSMHCARLFECNPRELPRRLHPKSKQRLQAQLAKAVERQDFERAIPMRDALARMAA